MKIRQFVLGQAFLGLTISIGCMPFRSTGSSAQSSSIGAGFTNGGVCGQVQARPDHALSEMPVTLTSGGQTRFVNLKGGAFERVLKFMNAGEKTICLRAKWEDIETPTLENFVLVSVPDFHGAEGGK